MTSLCQTHHENSPDVMRLEVNIANSGTAVWRWSWCCFIRTWLSYSHHLVSGSQDCTWPRHGSRPSGSWGPVRHEVPTERLWFDSQLGGLSWAPELSPWLTLLTQGTVCKEPQGSHSHSHMSSAGHYHGMLGWTPLPLSLSPSLSLSLILTNKFLLHSAVVDLDSYWEFKLKCNQFKNCF